MRILIANDDGYLAPGLAALVEACQGLGQIDVVAPEQNASGTSNALTLQRPLSVFRRRSRSGYRYLNGTPSDCVHVALTGLLPHRPDLVLSGINNGANMGDDTIYSGTVAAAMEGYLFGIPSIAFSLAEKGWAQLDSAARVARSLIEQVLARPPAPGHWLLNVNIPDRPTRPSCACAPATGATPCERAGDPADQSARRADLLDRRGRRRTRSRRGHRFPRGGRGFRVGHPFAGGPDRPPAVAAVAGLVSPGAV